MASIFLLFIFVFFVLLIGVLLFAWWETKNNNYGKIVAYTLLCLFVLFLLGNIIRFLTAKKELEKNDYYGEYIINREYFPGIQADWQYNNFRFEIKHNDSIYFYLTDKEKILKTYRGTIKTTDPSQYISERLILNMEQPTLHIITSNPTTYRSAWSFYLVFYSEKYNNVYFKKGHWKPLYK